MSLSKLNPFAIDVDTVVSSNLRDQYDDHVTTPNKPCNCGECVVNALCYGVSKVVHRSRPDGQMAWVPELNEDATAIVCFSADYVRKHRDEKCDGDLPRLYHDMLELGWRAHQREPKASTFFISDKKRKAEKPAATPTPKKSASGVNPQDLFPQSNHGSDDA